MSLHSNFVGPDSTATLAQQGTFAAYLATQDPWVIDSGATDHMTGTSSLLFDLEQSSSLPNVTLANGSTTTVSGLSIANLSPYLSLSSVLYIPDFPLDRKSTIASCLCIPTLLGLILLLLWLNKVLLLLVLPFRTLGSLTQVLLII